MSFHIFLWFPKRWGLLPSNKSKSPKQICGGGILQDGRFPYGEGPSGEPGLDDKDRYKGHLFSSANRSYSPEIPPVSMDGDHLLVPLPAIRAFLCPSHFHETDETSSGFPEGEGHQINHISRWPDHLLQQSRDPDTPANIGAGVVSVLRANHQLQEVTTDSNPRVGIPGPAYFDSQHDYLTAQGKTEQNPTRGQELTPKIRSDSTKISSFCGDDNSRKTGNTYEPSLSPAVTGSDKQSSSTCNFHRGSETELPPDGGTVSRSQARACMVGRGGPEVQQCSSAGKIPRLDNRIRCLTPGLGGNTEGSTDEDRGAMVSRGTVTPHQLLGANNNLFGSEILCKGQEEHQPFNQDRQHNSQSMHQSFWGDPLPSHECSSNRDMEMVHEQEHFPDSRTPPRGEEYRCR